MVLGNPLKSSSEEETHQDNNGQEVSGDCCPGLLAADLRWWRTHSVAARRPLGRRETAPIRLLQSSASPVTIWRHVNPGRDNQPSPEDQLSCVGMRGVKNKDFSAKQKTFETFEAAAVVICFFATVHV